MNWSTVALLFLAWQMLSPNKQSSPKLQDIAPFLNDDTKDILQGVSKLSSPTATSEDKTGAILQMMTNPTVMNIAQNLFGGMGNATPPQSDAPTPQPFGAQTPFTPTADTSPLNNTQPATDYQNDEGYTFDSPTERAKQFFAPIDTIATTEVKHKLCYFYDNWYLAK